MKIIVRTPNWLGDTLMALPAVESLRRHDSGAEVWIAAPPRVRDVFAGPEIGLPLFSGTPGSGANDPLRPASAVRAARFDAGLLLTNSFGSAMTLALARVPERWGYNRDGRGILLTRPVPFRRKEEPVHMVRYYLDLVEGLGFSTVPPEIRLSPTSEETALARSLLLAAGLDPARPLVVLHPGAAYGPAKRWPAERFSALARLLQDRRTVEIAVTGTEQDRPLAETVRAGLLRPAADLTGKTTLRGLLAVAAEAAVFVTNDSGPMHLANALRTPVVALFGPTDPAVTAPFHEPRTILKTEAVCRPCLYRQCPYDHRCLAGISADEAAAAVENYL
ncbi:MAG: lipopolysaccharide heptosyltransferase II [Candidatus Aminicenantes bacterium]|nr:lipopolysaccharide heptosyltransferase II [Candidatus Aminicenantes bacterium]